MFRCINCNRPDARREGDTFICPRCGYRWDVAHEQANAAYLAVQGREPALPLAAQRAVEAAVAGPEHGGLDDLSQPVKVTDPVEVIDLDDITPNAFDDEGEGEEDEPVEQSESLHDILDLTPNAFDDEGEDSEMDFQSMTLDELKDWAQAIDLPGRSSMNKGDLVAALQAWVEAEHQRREGSAG